MPGYHAKSHCQINEPWPKQMGGENGVGWAMGGPGPRNVGISRR